MSLRSLVLALLLTMTASSNATEISVLRRALQQPHPFHYPLDVQVIQGATADQPVMVCCPGYGGDSRLATVIHQSRVTKDHLVSFNFPDYQILQKGFVPANVAFGTIEELLPLIYILKCIVIDAHADQVSLYGFSAGAGAVVNAIAVLNQSRYDDDLRRVGIDNPTAKSDILKAIQKGVVLLDAPLKSMDEILEMRKVDPELQFLAQRYRLNGFSPIENLKHWQDLALNVIVFFQNPDNAVFNRDDQLFEQRLKRYNVNGRNSVLMGDEGGHLGFHGSLWREYQR